MKITETDEEVTHDPMRPPATRRRHSGSRSAAAVLEPPRPRVRRGASGHELRELGRLRAGHPVLSLYLDLAPIHFALPAARESQVQAILDAARQDIRTAWESLTHDDQQAVLDGIEDARAYLLGDLETAGARGLALFVSSPRAVFDAVFVDSPLESAGYCRPLPVLRPLFEVRTPVDWGMLAIDRREARLIVSRGGRPPGEVDRVTAETRGHRESSGARQARVERAVHHDTRQHVRSAVQRLERYQEGAPVAALVLACGEEIAPLVEADLGASLRAAVLGRVPYDPEAPLGDLVRLAGPLLMAREVREEGRVLDRLQEEVGRGTGAVGVDAVVEALNRDGVEVLILEHGLQLAGGVCRRCESLGLTQGTCPYCGGERAPEPDLVERMLSRAAAQSAEVRLLRFAPPHPGEPAHVAAVVRELSA